MGAPCDAGTRSDGSVSEGSLLLQLVRQRQLALGRAAIEPTAPVAHIHRHASTLASQPTHTILVGS